MDQEGRPNGPPFYFRTSEAVGWVERSETHHVCSPAQIPESVATPNHPSASLDMALKTTPYDSAQCLRTEEERAAYLATCMEEAPQDAAFIAHAVAVVARSRNMSQLARDTGLIREGL